MRKTTSTENPLTIMTDTVGERPLEWDDARDGTFFSITAGLFPAEFLYGASVLLASYDRS